MQPNTELILNALSLGQNASLKEQVLRVFNACDLDDAAISHILALHDKIARYECFVALSNSEDVFKIKCTNPQNAAIFNDIIKEWAAKYKFNLKKIDGKETYYILGVQK